MRIANQQYIEVHAGSSTMQALEEQFCGWKPLNSLKIISNHMRLYALKESSFRCCQQRNAEL